MSAQWIGTRRQHEIRKDTAQTEDGFANMGKPIPNYRRQNAYAECKAMGLTDNAKAHAVVGSMSDALERDEPYAAMEAGMTFLDLTGTYRLMAVLLVSPKPEEPSHEETPGVA